MHIRQVFSGIRWFLRKLKPRSWKRFFLMGGIAAGAGIALVLIVLIYYAYQVPDASIFDVRIVSESTKIYDRTGETILYDVHGEEKRTIIAWEKIPQTIKHATLAAEDSDFYSHGGVDFKGILRALYQDVRNLNASQGGSTITQQLVKKAVVGEQKTIARKIKEAILAIQIERAYSKDQIFWMYLNQIPYGSNAYGIEAASQTFFGKHAMELTIAEAATLAGIPKAPSYYSPYGTHEEQLRGRATYILKRMRDLGYITETEYQTALKETPQFKEEQDTFPAAHFVIMVREYLIEKYGADLVENGGLQVTTTLDLEKQEIAEEVVTKYGAINEKKYKATNAALVSMDPKTGQILAMVGSRDYFNTEKKGNFNVALSKTRQPGSSFKPFAYATAFLNGFTDSTVLFDLFTEFNPTCIPSGDQEYGTGACYHPRNYNGTFAGPVTMRQALSQSLNVPAVKTLYLAGIENTLETARNMGITTLDPDQFYGLSLVLGGAGVSLLDMTSAYGVFANDGILEPTTFIVKITTGDGSILEEYKQEEERVLPAQIARMVSDVLSDNNARGPVFGYNSSLVLPGRPVAAKTGTTQKNRDGWLIGYTPSLVAGIWTGNNDDTPMTQAGAGISAAGPMWNEYMSRVLKGAPVEYFQRPAPVATDLPDGQAGKAILNGDYHGEDGAIHDTLYFVNADDPQGPAPTNPYDDPQFTNWEYAVQQWISVLPLPFVTPLPE